MTILANKKSQHNDTLTVAKTSPATLESQRTESLLEVLAKPQNTRKDSQAPQRVVQKTPHKHIVGDVLDGDKDVINKTTAHTYLFGGTKR
jgi:hypothetical protein